MDKTDKIIVCVLTYCWIASWFIACWIYTSQLFFTGLFCLTLGIILYKKEDKNGQ